MNEWRWLRILRCRLRGGHFFSPVEWGYKMNGIVDLYCGNCGVRYGSMPLEDFEKMDEVLDLIGGDDA